LHFEFEFCHLLAQGVAYGFFETFDVLSGQIHFLESVVGFQAFNFVPVFPAIDKPRAGAQQGEEAQDDVSPVHLRFKEFKVQEFKGSRVQG